MAGERIVREDPPERTRYDWAAIAAQLRMEPGQWYKVFEDGPASTANAVRQGSIAAVKPEDGYETMTRNNTRAPRRTCTLYMRWMPPEGT